MAIRRIDKSYFPLEEIADEWQMPKSDLIYVVETGELTLSYRANRLRIETGEFEEIEIDHYHPVFLATEIYSGLLDLQNTDARTILLKGKAAVKSFRAPHPAYTHVDNPAGLIEIERSDLLITKAEKVRFETKLELDAQKNTKSSLKFTYNPTFTEVAVGDLTFRLGALQANVVAQLLKSAKAGQPWVSGKVVLDQAGSTSLRLADLFKSQPHWRRLIESDKSGLYRLHPSIKIR